MKVVLLARQKITGKDGRKWEKMLGFSQTSGEVVDIFMEEAQAISFGIPDSAIVPRSDFLEFLSQYTPVLAEFNNRGRVDEMSYKEGKSS